MKTVVVIQARMTSKRLPGKTMMPLGNKPVLYRVLERVKRVKLADAVVCAFPASYESRSMMELATAMNVPYVMGSETDVLARTYQAANEHGAYIVVRITADCPLIDPAVIDTVIALRARNAAPYASNVWPRSFPKGLDCEVFTFNILHEAYQRAKDAHDREHVTPWIVRHSHRVNHASGRFDLARINWSLDTADDLALLQAMFARGNPMSMAETLEIYHDTIKTKIAEAS